jgi:hypothetical protein
MANTITVSQYMTQVRNRLDDQSYDASKLLQFINDANREVCNMRRWRFMESLFVGNIEAGYSSYELPTGFQAAINFTLVDPDNVAIFLRYSPYEQFDQQFPDPTSIPASVPSTWTFFGNSLIVGPATPDKAYTMQLRFIKAPTTLLLDTNTLDVPDDFAEIIVLSAYKRALMTNDSFDQAQIVQQELKAQMDAMTERLQSRQFGEPQVVATSRTGRRWL